MPPPTPNSEEPLMHLLALGAFDLGTQSTDTLAARMSLNAPFGARCFLTTST